MNDVGDEVRVASAKGVVGIWTSDAGYTPLVVDSTLVTYILSEAWIRL